MDRFQGVRSILRADAAYADDVLVTNTYKNSGLSGDGALDEAWLDTAYWFAAEVAPQAAWDFKLAHDPRVEPGKDVMVFEGGGKSEAISPEDFGNIHFGYVAATLGIPLWVCLNASETAARNANGLDTLKDIYQEEYVDQPMITWGHNLGLDASSATGFTYRYIRYGMDQ